MDILLLIAVTLLIPHFVIPVAYYLYVKTKWLEREWGIRIDELYRPRISVIIPTFNEEEYIVRKLDNLLEQNYPFGLIEVLIVDDGSKDKTLDIAKEWMKKHPGLNVKLLISETRKGKMKSIFDALKYVSSEVIVITDADAMLDKNAILNTVKYFADSSVGALTASLKYYAGKLAGHENIYRDYYNVVRIAESKVHSTPVHSGVYQVIRKDILEKIPQYPYMEDCFIASYIAFSGYRAIQVDDVWSYEPLRGSTVRTKIRRAQFNIITFLNAKKMAKKNNIKKSSSFEHIWKIEWYSYIINPWLLPLGTTFLFLAMTRGIVISEFLLVLGALLLVLKTFRIWILQQVYLILAMLKNLWSIETIWKSKLLINVPIILLTYTCFNHGIC
jgi:cellulose synthase/poly-beta-1,6-N-acetylglucosamine synthase-like glycosyltransferase